MFCLSLHRTPITAIKRGRRPAGAELAKAEDVMAQGVDDAMNANCNAKGEVHALRSRLLQTFGGPAARSVAARTKPREACFSLA